ncbi:uncharacterized protein LOC141719079 [Apium graveolens]|uniref:uncharacterized protein LOC141719079 n=1 Tax=Apium graveolens TaxID=4045 RepID=UPI003D7B6387
MAEEGSFINKIFSSQVSWAGPNSRKGKEKNKATDEESRVKGNYEVGESSRKIVFERKRRISSEGDYSRKPPRNLRPTVYFLPNGKGLKIAKHKKTLAHIFCMKFDEQTIWTKGAAREAFCTGCIKNFKDYYCYPNGYDDEDGDEFVRAYLHRN